MATESFSSHFLPHLQDVLNQAARDLAVPLIERSTQEFREQLKRKIAELAISLAEIAEVERFGSKLVITVRFQKEHPS